MTDEEIKRFKENHEKLKQDIAWLRKYIKIYNTQDFLNEDIVYGYGRKTRHIL